MTATAIVQARMTSTRLPGKVLLPLGGEPMLLRLIDLPCAERGIVLKWVGRPANRVLGAAHIEVPSQAPFVSDHVSFSRFGQPRLKFGPRVFDPSHLG